MTLIPILFYIFSGLTLISATSVVFSRNPVYAVLWLIFAFFNAAGSIILLGAEFLAFIIIIVYVGAVAVLFLFVVMMLNVNIVEMSTKFSKKLWVYLFLGVILFFNIYLVIRANEINKEEVVSKFAPHVVANLEPQITNTELLGLVLYTDYFYPFQLAGFILLIAMVGSIVLTFRRRRGVKKQDIEVQLSRNSKDTVVLTRVKSRVGIDERFGS